VTDTSTHASLIADVRAFLTKAVQQHGKAAAEDLAVWDKFFDVYNEILKRFAARLRFRSQEQEDLTQDVWCRVIQDLPKYEYDPARGGFRRWLFTIVQCRAIDHARYRRARTSLKSRPVDSRSMVLGFDAAEAATPGDALDRQFKQEVVRAAMELFRTKATEQEWEAFELCRLQNLSGPEAAAKLGIAPAALRKRLERASVKLRAAIVDLVGTEEL
jgi:RNA polymerase sigma-70 factor (ECF subfamily)